MNTALQRTRRVAGEAHRPTPSTPSPPPIFPQVPPTRIIVAYDDLDTAPGGLRVKPGGGHGGHNGVRSIMASLGGAKDFPRVRIGK